MTSKRNFALVLTLGLGLLGTAATAQDRQTSANTTARLEYATADPGQGGQFRLADWDDHRRCDGDHDRDDRNCYYRGYDRDRYHGYSYYGNGYVAPYTYSAPPAGWYDRYGYWHAYNRDRDRDRRRHDDDDDRR